MYKKKVREAESRKKITKDVKTQTYMPLGHNVLYYWAFNHPSLVCVHLPSLVAI